MNRLSRFAAVPGIALLLLVGATGCSEDVAEDPVELGTEDLPEVQEQEPVLDEETEPS